MAKNKSITLAVVADVHCGSTVAMVPPEGVKLDDGGSYHPSKPNLWLWKCWEDYWKRVEKTQLDTKSDLYIIYNGDLFDGDHHRTAQIVSPNPEAQGYIADRAFSVPLGLQPKGQFVVRGTEAHVGSSGSAEEALAKGLGAIKNEEIGTHSWWNLSIELNGVLIEAQHHGSIGRKPWTKTNTVMSAAAHVFYEHARKGWRWPNLCFRSHQHRYGDSYNSQPVRLIQTPAWQLKTAFIHKVSPNEMPDIGGLIATITPEGRYTVEEVLYEPERRNVWHA